MCTNGYTKDEEGALVIVPEEAEIVMRIYRGYLDEASLLQIGHGLEEDGVKLGAGSTCWLSSTLKKIFTNEKYIGEERFIQWVFSTRRGLLIMA